jgi:hypothetical protein
MKHRTTTIVDRRAAESLAWEERDLFVEIEPEPERNPNEEWLRIAEDWDDYDGYVEDWMWDEGQRSQDWADEWSVDVYDCDGPNCPICAAQVKREWLNGELDEEDFDVAS